MQASDADGEGFNAVSLSLKGEAKAFLVLDEVANNRYTVSLSDLPAEGQYELIVVAKDGTGKFKDVEMKLAVVVEV